MIEAKPFPNEEQRLASLRSLRLLDMPIEQRFEKITQMICKVMDVPIALFNLIDKDRQHYKSAQGLTNTDASLESAFCTHALHEADMLLVPNAKLDVRFHDNPFVTGEYLNIGFYAGVPVHTPDGMPVGTLCAIDTRPRQMSPEQLATLRNLAQVVEGELNVMSQSHAQANILCDMNETRTITLLDPLTRLWNRDGVDALSDPLFKEAVLQKNSVSIVIAKVDALEKVSDIFGPEAGNNILRGVAKKILGGVQPQDIAAYDKDIGFIIMLPGRNAQKAADLANVLREAVNREPLVIGQQQHGDSTFYQSYPVTISAGVATTVLGSAKEKSRLIHKAEENLKKARKGEGNKVLAS